MWIAKCGEVGAGPGFVSPRPGPRPACPASAALAQGQNINYLTLFPRTHISLSYFEWSSGWWFGMTQSGRLGPCSWKAEGSEIYPTQCRRAVACSACRVFTGAWILGTFWVVSGPSEHMGSVVVTS